MSPTRLHKNVLMIALAVAAVGALDASIGGQPDLAAIFVLLGLLQLTLLTRLQTKRPALPLRADLIAWLSEQGAINGEPMEAVADRVLATHRAGLAGE